MSEPGIAIVSSPELPAVKKLILHIGMSKTGTSAIQDACVRYRSELKAAGVLFPETGRMHNRPAHYGFVFAAKGRRGFDLSVLRDQLATEAREVETVIISAEALWLLDSRSIKRLADAVAAYDVTVLLYLRDPVDYLLSSYRQGIQTGRRRTSFAVWLNSRRGQLNYHELVKRWERHFEVEVLDYDQERSALVPRFMQRFGIIASENQRVHVTPSEFALKAMLWVNRTERFIGRRAARLLRRRLRRLQRTQPKDNR